MSPLAPWAIPTKCQVIDSLCRACWNDYHGNTDSPSLTVLFQYTQAELRSGPQLTPGRSIGNTRTPKRCRVLCHPLLTAMSALQ